MYYLKYRPKLINEIDNETPRETIKKILQSDNIPHAYLFVGQKGTGKTSAARIFAKSVNCLSRPHHTPQHPQTPNIEPCNHCANCLMIESSSSVDVVELDAASNRGINEVKELIREANFSPMTNKYRVFIIDEAHMITSDGFNALLKTLEEPPPTVIFILATTNLEKVPKTIRSRCVQVNFGKAKTLEIVHMLERIADHEKVKINKDLSNLIARHCDRSFRDAAKLLEELVIQNKLEINEATNYIGIRSKENVLNLMQKKSINEAIAWIEQFAQSGGSFKILIEELLEELRQILLAKSGVKIEEEIKTSFTLTEVSLLMKLLNEAYVNLKNTPIESIPLEIAVVEFYNKRVVSIK